LQHFLGEIPWIARQSSANRELIDAEVSAVGGGSAAWGGVGAALGFSFVVAYLVSPGKAH